MDLVISAWFFPPYRNLDISSAKRLFGQKKVSLILNPDTSLKDIEDAWPEIKKEQEKLWPNYKKINLTKKSYSNLNIAIEDKLKTLFGNKKRRDSGDSGSHKYTLTDAERAGIFWPDEKDISREADEKRAANLRQIRKRFKEK